MNKNVFSVVALVFALAILVPAVSTSAVVSTVVEFERTWERTDKPVAEGQVSRTWMWGPQPFTEPITEDYIEGPDGIRVVQYFDKSRMEITDPNADPESIWFVTNGLLSTELITGRLQLGNDTFEQREPAQINVAGDANDPTGPTYATFNALLDAAPAALQQAITQRVNRDGLVTQDAALGGLGVTAVHLDEVTNHAIAEPFWLFMTATGMVYEDGVFTIAPLFENPFFATGRPITEAYWANVLVAGTPQDVLMQCFERRCLTYTPANDPGWQVEAGNVGQHYYAWRYAAAPGPDATPTATQPAAPTPTPTPTQPTAPTPTATPTQPLTPTPTATPTQPPTPTPTATPTQPPQPPPSIGCVNINTASFDDLRRIIHIDVDRAQQIISLRPFSSVDDLTRVSGIGPARLADIKSQGLACV